MERNEQALLHLTVAFTTAKAPFSQGTKCRLARWAGMQRRKESTQNIPTTRHHLRDQDPSELFDHFMETNAQYRIEMPDKKKLIALALEKLPKKYVNAFSPLRVNGNHGKERNHTRKKY
jgi:hypothetical protein